MEQKTEWSTYTSNMSHFLALSNMSPFLALSVGNILTVFLCLLMQTQGLTSFVPPNSLPFVMKQAGKTVFRPGGTDATQQLLHWAGVQANNSTTMIQTISPYQNDSQHLPNSSSSILLLEATLTHQPDSMKIQILQSLNGTQQLLLHDVCLPNCTADSNTTIIEMIRHDLTQALGTGFYALSVDEWKELVQQNGYQVMECQQGMLQSMSPKRLIQEEGWRRAVGIVWNLLTHPQWRERVKLARTTMTQYNDSLGYVILRAVQANTSTTTTTL